MRCVAWFLVGFFVLAATFPSQCNGGGGSNPPEPVELTQEVRPVQGGTQVDVAYSADIDTARNRGRCTYAVFVRDTDVYSATYDESGILTAGHCALRGDSSVSQNLSSTGQDVWQSFEGDTAQTDRIVARVTRRTPYELWGENECPAFDDQGNSIEYCLRADALFAKLEPDLTLADAGLANVALSVDDVELTIENPDDYDRYVGAQSAPFANSRVYKIGRTTGKTRGVVVDRIPELTIRDTTGNLYIDYDMYAVQPEDHIKMAAGGDSGAPVLYQNPESMGQDGYALVGIVVAATREGVMFMDLWGEIRDELSITITNGY